MRARRVAPLIALALLLASTASAACGQGSSAEEAERPTTAAEPVLGADSVAPARERPGAERSEGRSAPTVVRALAPGQALEGGGPASEEKPPERIRRQNVRLRRELEHLRALERERRRIARALAAAGVTGGLFGSGRLAWPLAGPVTSPFGMRWGRLHAGIDIAVPGGTPIRAADSGRVALAGWQGGYGLYTCVQHTADLVTCYAHQSRLGTTVGALVRKGQVIGYVGNTGYSFGDHLHFETWVRGRPVDPMGFL